jgi:hypothetical protein
LASRRRERAIDAQAVGRSNATYSTTIGLPLIHSAPNPVPEPIGPSVSLSTRLVLGFHSASLVTSAGSRRHPRATARSQRCSRPVTQPRRLTSRRHLQPEVPGGRTPSDTNRTPSPRPPVTGRVGSLDATASAGSPGQGLFEHPLLHD